MAEEHRCQAPPEGHRLCANNCGFFGIPATMNLCSTCYRDYCFKEQQRKQQSASLVSSLPSPPLLPLQLSSSASSPAAVESQPELAVPEAGSTETEEVATAAAVLKTANRCTMCRKKVGLTGFRCRCGITFCGVHRYPEKHGCTFDFKRAGREEIARANPLVVADKIRRI